MRLLYVVNVDWYFCLHWVERALALRERGWDIHVLTKVTDHKNVAELKSMGISVHDINLKRKSKNILAELKLIYTKYRNIKAIKPDLIHLVTIKPAIYGGLVSKLLKIPSITSMVGLGVLVSKDKKDYILSYLIKLLLRASVSRTLVFENSADMDIIKQLGTDSRLVVINGAGVDTETFTYTPLPDNEITKILFASRLLWKKGLKHLLDVCDKLVSDGFQIELHVAGINDSDSDDAIPQHVIEQWHEEEKIVWHGNIKNMPELISSCDIVCLPTIYGEGVPRILIEAASCGRPIIATDIPGCRDIVINNENGFLFSPDDKSGLYKTMDKALKNKSAWPDMGLCGRELVKDSFSNDVVIRKWLDIYDSLAQKYNLEM